MTRRREKLPKVNVYGNGYQVIEWLFSARKGTASMFKLILLVLAIAAGYMFVQTYPDLQRYLKIRAM